MGNPLKKVLPWIDPLGNAANKALGGENGIGGVISNITGAQPATPPPGYDPSKNPGTTLQSAPAGGPPGAGGPSSGLFGSPTVQPGYTPNPWQTSGASMGNRVATPGAPAPGGPSGGPVNAFRGGTPPVAPPPGSQGMGAGMRMPPTNPNLPGGLSAGPPAMMTGNQGMPPGGPQNPQLQQQLAIAQMLRGNPGQPPGRSMIQ